MNLATGDVAPSPDVRTLAGIPVSVSDFWKSRPVALFFVRHFGWPTCREHVVDVRRSYAKFSDAGGAVAVV